MAKIPFKVSARAGKLLGRENFSNPEGAIIELVKNSYDADANNCFAVTEVTLSEPDYLEVMFELSDINCFEQNSGAIYANTSGGTIPILLDEIKKSGRLKRNDIVLFAAVGSGWTYGASIIKWSE